MAKSRGLERGPRSRPGGRAAPLRSALPVHRCPFTILRVSQQISQKYTPTHARQSQSRPPHADGPCVYGRARGRSCGTCMVEGPGRGRAALTRTLRHARDAGAQRIPISSIRASGHPAWPYRWWCDRVTLTLARPDADGARRASPLCALPSRLIQRPALPQ